MVSVHIIVMFVLIKLIVLNVQMGINQKMVYAFQVILKVVILPVLSVQLIMYVRFVIQPIVYSTPFVYKHVLQDITQRKSHNLVVFVFNAQILALLVVIKALVLNVIQVQYHHNSYIKKNVPIPVLFKHI